MTEKVNRKIARETDSNRILSDYFLNKSAKNDLIPYMTDISKETGVSHATISRYAKKKGYYNFAELRANFNKTLDREIEDNLDLGLIQFLRDNKSIIIATTRTASLIGQHIKERLVALGFTVKMLPFRGEKNVEGDFEIEPGDAFITVSLSFDRYRATNFLKMYGDHKIFFITTDEIKSNHDNLMIAALTEFKYISRNSYEMFKSIKKINDWLNDVLNVLHIEMINDYGFKK